MTTITKYFGFNKILSIFPSLYNYKEYAPLLLRLSIGFIFIIDGLQDFKKKTNLKLFTQIIGALKIISGAALVFGIYTQLWTIVILVISLLNGAVGIHEGNWPKLRYHLVISVIAVSLALSGPGLYAIDLPL